MSQKIEVKDFGKTYRIKYADAECRVFRQLARWIVPGCAIEMLPLQPGMDPIYGYCKPAGKPAAAPQLFTLPPDTNLPPAELPGVRFVEPLSAIIAREGSTVPRLRVITRRQLRREQLPITFEVSDATTIAASMSPVRQDESRAVL